MFNKFNILNMGKVNAAIRDVEKEKWIKFKSEAAMHGMKMGEFFGFLIDEHRAHEISDNVKEILDAAGHISKKTIAQIEKAAREFGGNKI